MYTLLKKALILLSDIEQIFSPAYKHPKRAGMLLTYIRLRVKASLSRWFHFKKERFLSYTVEFPDYEIFFTTFRQVFVRHAYYFETDSPKPTIIDCGGNIGMSVLYFKYLYPNANITVFEPSKEVLPSIRHNIAHNKLTDVTLVEKAVSDTVGVATMLARGEAACGNTLKGEGMYHVKFSGVSYDVETVILSPFVTGEIAFLKLDIEGSEGGVLRELDKAGVLAKIQAITMEYHDIPAYAENSLGEIIALLEKYNWKVEPFSEDAHTIYSLSLRTRSRSTAV